MLDAHDKKMPHLLASISVALDALGTSCMVELCGPDMRGAHGKVRTALRRTGLEVQAKPIVNGVTLVFQVPSHGMPRKSDVRLDRVIVILSDALEEASFALATMTTDNSGSFFLMFKFGANVAAEAAAALELAAAEAAELAKAAAAAGMVDFAAAEAEAAAEAATEAAAAGDEGGDGDGAAAGTNISGRAAQAADDDASEGKAQDARVRCSHLLCKHTGSRNPVSRRTGERVTLSKEDAISELETIAKELTWENFAEQAAARSDCGSHAKGGDLGVFGRGMMQQRFEEAGFALDVGEISGIVDTDSGMHIIFRTE